jgi:hypothetical protein
MKKAQRVAAVSCFVLLCVATRLDSTAALKMDVTPSISRAPASVQVRVVINAGPDDREFHLAAESGSFYRSSAIALDGASSGGLNVFELKDLPSGTYEISGVLVDAHGPRARVLRTLRVEPGLGGR